MEPHYGIGPHGGQTGPTLSSSARKEANKGTLAELVHVGTLIFTVTQPPKVCKMNVLFKSSVYESPFWLQQPKLTGTLDEDSITSQHCGSQAAGAITYNCPQERGKNTWKTDRTSRPHNKTPMFAFLPATNPSVWILPYSCLQKVDFGQIRPIRTLVSLTIRTGSEMGQTQPDQ